MFRQEIGERTGQRRSPFAISPRQRQLAANMSARLELLLRTRAYRLGPRRYRPVRRSFPRSECRRRRDGKGFLSVLLRATKILSHSRDSRRAASTDYQSGVRRRGMSRHVGGIPKGSALWPLLPTSGGAEAGRRRQIKEFYKPKLDHIRRRQAFLWKSLALTSVS